MSKRLPAVHYRLPMVKTTLCGLDRRTLHDYQSVLITRRGVAGRGTPTCQRCLGAAERLRGVRA